MANFTIDQIVIPESIEDPDAADFIEMTNVRNAIEADTMGNRDLAYEPAELLPNWQNPYEPQTCLVARVGKQIVARAVYQAPIEPGAIDVWFDIEVLPAFRRLGIGSALLERLASMGEADGRTVQQSYVIHKAAEGVARLQSPTGFGAVPRDNAETQFLLSRGFSLEQVERISRLDLPLDAEGFSESVSLAAEASGPEYRIVNWTGRTPVRWLAHQALLRQRMSTDAPWAGMEFTEEEWNEDRVSALEDGLESSPRIRLVTGIEHVASGALVGFTELSVPPELERPVQQQDTLVLKEHRGHRLGMLLKLANLQHLLEKHPGHPAVTTFNAEENRHMLRVNEAIGFVAVGYGGGWKKVLAN